MKSFRVDLRSDTVTKPSAAMRRAMAEAEVGDDWFGDDPTVNRLQERAAEITGKEAALYVPSGTMANQIALKILTRPGDDVVVGDEAHIVWHESGAAAAWCFRRPMPRRSVLRRVSLGLRPTWTARGCSTHRWQAASRLRLLRHRSTLCRWLCRKGWDAR